MRITSWGQEGKVKDGPKEKNFCLLHSMSQESCIIWFSFMVLMQALKFHTLLIAIYHYCNLDLVVTIAKIVQNDLKTKKQKSNYYIFGPVYGYLTRSTVILNSNSCKGCFNQVTFYDFQNFCQGKVVVKIFWAAQF